MYTLIPRYRYGGIQVIGVSQFFINAKGGILMSSMRYFTYQHGISTYEEQGSKMWEAILDDYYASLPLEE